MSANCEIKALSDRSFQATAPDSTRLTLLLLNFLWGHFQASHIASASSTISAD